MEKKISIKQARADRQKKNVKELMVLSDTLQGVANRAFINRTAWKGVDVPEDRNDMFCPEIFLIIENQARALARTLLELVEEETGMYDDEIRDFIKD